MARYLTFLLIVFGLVGLVAAQDTSTFISRDGSLTFELPEVWEASESDLEYPLVTVTNVVSYGQLSVFNIKEACGPAGAFVNPLAFSCDPEPEALLPYAMEVEWRTGVSGDEKFFTEGEIGCVTSTDGYFLGCAKDAGDSYFFLITMYGGGGGLDISESLDVVKTILNSATYGTAPLVNNADFPLPERAEDGWTLDVSAFALSPEARIVLGADERIYIADVGKIVVLNQDGTVERFIESNTLPYIMDFAVTSDGRLWILDGSLELKEFDTEGQVVETIDLSEGTTATVLQVEATTEGDLVALEYDEMTGEANVVIYDPNDMTQTRFDIVEEGVLYFEAEAFLSMAKLAAISSDEIYVFSEHGSIIRAFDSEGKIVIPSVNEEPLSYFYRLGLAQEGFLDMYEGDTVTRFNLDDLSTEKFTQPTPSAVLVDETHILALFDNELRLETWEPVPADE